MRTLRRPRGSAHGLLTHDGRVRLGTGLSPIVGLAMAFVLVTGVLMGTLASGLVPPLAIGLTAASWVGLLLARARWARGSVTFSLSFPRDRESGQVEFREGGTSAVLHATQPSAVLTWTDPAPEPLAYAGAARFVAVRGAARPTGEGGEHTAPLHSVYYGDDDESTRAVAVALAEGLGVPLEDASPPPRDRGHRARQAAP